jgi:hypothetical protein
MLPLSGEEADALRGVAVLEASFLCLPHSWTGD